MNIGIKSIGYMFGKNALEKSTILDVQNISQENQERIWPASEGFPFIPMFESVEEIVDKLDQVFNKVHQELEGSTEATHYVISLNGTGDKSVNASDLVRTIESHTSNYSVIDGSCSGSITSIQLFKGLLEQGYCNLVFIAISDRARVFGHETPLYSINYGDAVAYYLITKNRYQFEIKNIVEFNDTKVMDAKVGFPYERKTMVANKAIYNYETDAFSKIANRIRIDKDSLVVLPRLSPVNRNCVAQLFSDANYVRHPTWPISMFSGCNWIIDFQEIFGNLKESKTIYILAIGVGFCWTLMELEGTKDEC